MEQPSSVCDGCLFHVGNTKQLPCAHQFCSKCLQNCIRKELKVIVCPSCHAKWSIKMSKEKRTIAVQKQVLMCNVCQMEAISSRETGRCSTCIDRSQCQPLASKESSTEMDHVSDGIKVVAWSYGNFLTLAILLSFVFVAPAAYVMTHYANGEPTSTEDSDYLVNNDQVLGMKDGFLSDIDLDQNMDKEISEANAGNDMKYNTLELEMTFGDKDDSLLHNPSGISVSVTGDVAVTDWDRNRVIVFDSSGKIKFQLDTRLDLDYRSTSNPVSVAIASSGHFYVTDFNPWVNVYNPEGSHLFQFPIESSHDIVNPIAHPRRHLRGHGVTTDNSGRVFVGEYWNNRVSIHKPKGGMMASFNVSVEPRFISVSQSKIAIGCLDCRRAIQVVDYTGKLLFTLQNPFEENTWSTRGVCFTKHRGDILVASYSKGKTGIYRFSSKGKFVDWVTREVSDPRGIDTSADGTKVFVIDKAHVKVFQWK